MVQSVAGLPPFLQWDDSLDLSRFTKNFGTEKISRYIEEGDGFIIKAQVVVEESGTDELQISEHPVQQGAVIADHAVKRPAEVRMRMGWSAAYLADSGNDGTIRLIYDRILRLQSRRIPFTIYTGKRVYENMLIASLQVNTDQHLEYTFMADISFREVVVVGTSVLLGGANWLYSGYQLERPDKNSFTTEGGTVQTTKANVPEDQWQKNIPPDALDIPGGPNIGGPT